MSTESEALSDVKPWQKCQTATCSRARIRGTKVCRCHHMHPLCIVIGCGKINHGTTSFCEAHAFDLKGVLEYESLEEYQNGPANRGKEEGVSNMKKEERGLCCVEGCEEYRLRGLRTCNGHNPDDGRCEVLGCGKRSSDYHDCEEHAEDGKVKEEYETHEDYVRSLSRRNDNKQEATMSKTTTEELKDNATEAGYRIAGRQLTKLTRDPLAAFIAGNGADESTRAKIAEFLRTEVGEAMVSAFLSVGLAASKEEHAAALSRELRVKAMTDAGDVVADLIMGPLRKVTADYLSGSAIHSLPVAPERVKAPEVEVEVNAEAKAR